MMSQARRTLVIVLLLAALAASVAAFVYLTFIYTWSTAYYVDERQVLIAKATSWQDEGLSAYLVWLTLPVVLCLIILASFLSGRRRLAQVTTWSVGTLVTAFGLLTILTVGILYLPIGIVVIAAAVLQVDGSPLCRRRRAPSG